MLPFCLRLNFPFYLQLAGLAKNIIFVTKTEQDDGLAAPCACPRRAIRFGPACLLVQKSALQTKLMSALAAAIGGAKERNNFRGYRGTAFRNS